MNETEPTLERHATRAADWRVYGHNLALEAEHVGHFPDARRLMLDAWEAWTSGEPDPDEVLYELLATWWAMAMASGVDGLEDPLEALAGRMAERFAAQ
jgi:hypothetical protein